MNKLHKRNISLLLSGRLISLIGNGIQNASIPLYILDSTGSGTLIGIFEFFAMIPIFLMAPLSGVLGDRYNRKKIMILMDLGRFLMFSMMSILAYMGRINFILLILCQMCISIMDSLFNSASDAIIPDLSPHENLEKVNAFKGISDGISMVIGPCMGGILYGLFGIKIVFLFNSISFLLSAVMEILLIYKKTFSKKETLSFKVFTKEIHEVLIFIKRNTVLKQLFLFAIVFNFLATPIFVVVTPYFLKKVVGFNAQQFGFLQAFFVMGLILGNITFASFFTRFKTKNVMKASALVQNIFMMLFAITTIPAVFGYFGGASWHYFTVIALLFTLTGLFNACITLPALTNMQKVVSTEMRSRFFSISNLLMQLAYPLGTLILGILLDKIPAHFVIISLISVIFVLVLVFLFTATEEVFEPHLAVNREDGPK